MSQGAEASQSKGVVLISAMAFRRHGRAYLERLQEEGYRTLESPVWRPLREEELLELLDRSGASAHVVGMIAGNDRVTQQVLERLPRLRVISRWGIGTDAIDLQAATERGVMVTNTPGLLGDAVADLAFGLLLALARRIPAADRLVRAGRWEELTGVAVWGKALGIVGFGSTGQAMARRGRGFGMTVRVYDPYADREAARRLGVRVTTLEELLQESDFVSLHAALTPETQGLINAQRLAMMKPGAFLVNVARGGLVDENALLQALERGHLAGAALDTHAIEPVPPGHPFLEREDVILTPHIGFSTREAIAAVNEAVYRNLIAGIQGEQPPHVVNPKALTYRKES